ncbi:hypothetical protein MFRU_007g01370 [Monilinia fructicola]|nr:hypothetical protein MFRU_007g01370 [Monilinia fructicola]
MGWERDGSKCGMSRLMSSSERSYKEVQRTDNLNTEYDEKMTMMGLGLAMESTASDQVIIYRIWEFGTTAKASGNGWWY